MIDPFAWMAGWLQETLIVPLLWQFGWMQWEDVSFMWALFAIYGVLQVAINCAICMPMERLRPLRPVPADSIRSTVAIDILYTLIARVGLFPLVMFFGFYQTQTWINGALADRGYVPPSLETVFPVLLGMPVLSFLLYAAVLDFADYWRHRLSHRFAWWYGLHAVHHAQRHMTFWSDDRNHVLDDAIGTVWFIAIGLLIGVPPMQFPLLVLCLRLVESLSHANTRVSYGWLGERLLVSPRFHRAHHGLRASGPRSGNFGAVFPWWDMLFGTADFHSRVVETGDLGADEAMATGGWLAQQRSGLRRAWHLARRRRPAAAE